ncbi:MAG: hypothetical protein V4595_12995 [Pseudomonadota bacterium]|jgi:hypothetical protein
MRVELDIFSGRPNPVWELDAQAAAPLAARLAGLSEHASRAVDLPDLGYRGFVFHSDACAGRACRGSVDLNGTTFRDPAFAIERLLVASLPDAWHDLRMLVERILLLDE